MNYGYDKIIGYSPLEDVDREKLRHLIEINKTVLDQYFSVKPNTRILVAGAGQGDEAELVFENFNAETVGVDLNICSLNGLKLHKSLSFFKQDLEHLGFENNSFSLVYCYHVLEHVSSHLAVLRELQRVLIPGGVLFIGFPNKHRLISYIGTSQKVSVLKKIQWNLNDYLYKLKGKFENHNGAHAGFSESEFLFQSLPIFQNVRPVRNEYMLVKYAGLQNMIRIVISMGLGEFIFPSNYYICIK